MTSLRPGRESVTRSGLGGQDVRRSAMRRREVSTLLRLLEPRPPRGVHAALTTNNPNGLNMRRRPIRPRSSDLKVAIRNRNAAWIIAPRADTLVLRSA